MLEKELRIELVCKRFYIYVHRHVVDVLIFLGTRQVDNHEFV
jgi:hypothetical protein